MELDLGKALQRLIRSTVCILETTAEHLPFKKKVKKNCFKNYALGESIGELYYYTKDW